MNYVSVAAAFSHDMGIVAERGCFDSPADSKEVWLRRVYAPQLQLHGSDGGFFSSLFPNVYVFTTLSERTLTHSRNHAGSM
jgi:hypothetical protein